MTDNFEDMSNQISNISNETLTINPDMIEQQKQQEKKIEPKKIVICLPGKSYSNNFLLCWSNLLNYCNYVGHQIVISNSYNPNVYYVRNECLGADVMKGIGQQPFQGKVDYDFMFWIDSDVLFTPKDFQTLIDMNQDISTGCYIMSDNKNYAIVEHMDNKFFRENGYYKFISREEMANKTESFNVDYAGFGFMCIKKGVFESLQYPFFRPRLHEFNINGTVVRDYSSEDVSWCIDIREQGYKIVCNPAIKVGHEKSFVLV